MQGSKHEVVPLPPVLFAAAFATGALIQRLAPVRVPDTAWLRIPGAVLICLASVLAVAAIAELVHAGTTIRPDRPAVRFVSSGPYEFTRNPMYLAATCLYAGLAVAFRLFWPLLFLPAAVWAVNRFVIPAEERFLSGRFGPEYIAYTRRVRRWI